LNKVISSRPHPRTGCLYGQNLHCPGRIVNVHDSWQNVDMVRLPALDSNGDGKLSAYELGLRRR